jgi:hypothetical protein
MNLVTRRFALITLSAAALLVNGKNRRSAAHAQMADHRSTTDAGETTQNKIARAMSAGPADIAKSARIVDAGAHGEMVVLREGNNGFTCIPGNPRVVGDPPKCASTRSPES